MNEDNTQDTPTSVPMTPLQPATKVCVAPLPYLYDPDDERIQTILHQVTEHCEITLEETEMRPVEKPEPTPDEPGKNPEGPGENPEEPGTSENTNTPFSPTGQNGHNEAKANGDNTDTPSSSTDENGEEPTEPTNPEEPTDPDEPEMEEVVVVEGEKPEEVWRRVWQAIRYLSNHSCWTDSDDDTFILQCRTEQFTAETICGCTRDCCQCDPDQIVLTLSYSPYPKDPLVEADVTVVVNGKVARLNIDHNYLNEHFDPYTGKLYIMREDFPEFFYAEGYKDCCLCKRHLTITLHYNAGYKTIPAALLPLICPMMAQIDEAKIPLSDCASAMTKVSGLLKSLKKGDVQYTWSDTDTAASRTNALFTDMFDVALVTELASISRCEQIIVPDEFGDVI